MTSKMKQGTIRGAIAAGVAGAAILVSVMGSGAANGGPSNDCYGGGGVIGRAGCVIITSPSTSSSTTSVTVTTTAPQGTVPETTVPEVTTPEVPTTMGETTTTKPAVQGNAAAAKPATQVRGQANFTG